jgi:hypothetical protein
MDLPVLVQKHIAGKSYINDVLEWWMSMKPGNSRVGFFRRNITNDMLFENSPNVQWHLTQFAKGIKSTPTFMHPIQKALFAIKRNRCMVMQGPAAEEIEGILCRITTPILAWVHLADGPLPKGRSQKYNAKFWKAWLFDIEIKDSFKRKFFPSKEVRGKVPIAFWAVEEDINNKERQEGNDCDLRRLCKLLGLTLYNAKPAILLRINSGAAGPKAVPTAWDSIDNQYFLCQPPGARVGWTLDRKTNKKGVREVVTMPIKVKDMITPRLIE